MELEELIDKANRCGYSTYVSNDLESRVVSIIRNIEQVVASDTDKIDENAYNLATMKIAKADRISAEGHAPQSTAYYAQDLLDSFADAIPDDLQKQLQKDVAELKEMDEKGSYDESINAYKKLKEDLDDDRLRTAGILTDIQYAGQVCIHQGEPARAPKFFKAISDILQAISDGNLDKLQAIMDDVMPEVGAILSREESETQKIFKDITK